MVLLISSVKLARHSDPAAYLLTPDKWADQPRSLCWRCEIH
nr:hypothetical protein [Kibdelosporangium sp. MJ126-NF4]CTQ89467.1 hypothetical protein [Kibdelosporangium sp. MJ126-NF4]